MPFFKLGKTHLPHRKSTAAMSAQKMSAPPQSLLIPMSMHIGAPAKPIVNPGDRVFVGTLIAEAGGFVSAPIHSSVSGTVKKIESYLSSQGKTCMAIRIESDGEMTPDPAIIPPSVTDFASLSDAARASGLVGLGGAGFPTSVKLAPSNYGKLDALVVNCAECEPYITSDTRTVLDNSEFLKEGIELVLAHSGISKAYIGIEKNKCEAINKLNAVFSSNEKVEVVVLPDKYPQGAEKILIYNVLGRIVPEGGLPADVGVLVMNVTSVATLAKYVKTGMPLVEKCITVDGSAVDTPKNLIVPIGTPIKDVLAECGVDLEKVGKVLYGGPMMGISVYSIDDPILKNTNAITVLSVSDAMPKKQNPCIHCGRCVQACPMGLMPTVFAKSMNVDLPEERAQRLTLAKVNLCIECGCCSYVCPSARPLVETNRLAKAELRDFNAKNQNANGGDKK